MTTPRLIFPAPVRGSFGRIARLGACLFCGSVLLFGACATNEQVTKLENRLRNAESRIAHQDSTVATLESAQKSGQSAKQSDIAALKSRIDNLERDIEQLTSTVTDLEQRVTQMQKRGGGTIKPITDKQPDSSQAPPKQSAVDCVRLFDDAFIQMRQEHYESAITGFRDVIKYCEGTEQADKSLYWIGEAFFSQRNYREAATAFGDLVSVSPAGAKNLPTAMYKLARSNEELGDSSSARKEYQKIIDKFPSTSEAQLARDKLKEMK